MPPARGPAGRSRRLLRGGLGALLLAPLLAAGQWQARRAAGGSIELAWGGRDVASMAPGLLTTNWTTAAATALPGTSDDRPAWNLVSQEGACTAAMALSWPDGPTGAVRVAASFVPVTAIAPRTLHVDVRLPAQELAGRDIVIDQDRVMLPREFDQANRRIWAGRGRQVTLDPATPPRLRFVAPHAVPVLCQDLRHHEPAALIRMGGEAAPGTWLAAGSTSTVTFTIHPLLP